MTAVSYKKVLLDKRELTGFLVKEVKALPDRLTGLRNHCNLDKNHGILLKGKIVHTYGMSFPIDIFFLDRHGRVLQIIFQARPSQFIYSQGHWKTKSILELKEGSSKLLNIKEGSCFEFV